MEINTFWKIVLKGIGLWFLMNCFYIVPQFFSRMSFMQGDVNWNSFLLLGMGNLSIVIIFILITRLFLFKTQWIINVLRLDKHFNEQKIDISIPDSKLLSIVIIIIGALIFLQSLPELFSTLLDLLKPKTDPEIIKTNNSDSYWTLYHFIRAITGFLIMTNSKIIVNFIEKKSAAND